MTPADLPIHAPAGSAAPLLRIERVTKRFAGVTAVDDLTLAIDRGEFFALLGPSGCGKTTLLRMLAGFETPDAGRILLGDVDIAATPPHRRPVNMMFQNYALFPHLDVRNNIAFGLKRMNLARAEIEARVDEMLMLVGLGDLQSRKPDQLSGGQRQRVALARALARRPQLLLLDEPLAALDKKLRETTQAELMALQRRLGATFVIVTHDQDEAMVMADRIGVMNAGRLEQAATPRGLYETPNSRWVAGFVGDINLIEARITGQEDNCLIVETQSRDVLKVVAPENAARDQDVCIAVRPEKIRLIPFGKALLIDDDPTSNRLDGVIGSLSYLGGVSHYAIRLDSGATLRAALANGSRRGEVYQPGERISAWFSPDDCAVLTR